jgi:hypothetical protein
MVAVFPVERRGIGLAKEAAGAVGTPVLPTVGVPCEKFTVEDKINPLVDKSWRQAMPEEYGYTQGTYLTDWDASGPVYADTIGHFLLNVLGDYTTTAVTPITPTTTLNGGLAIGTTTVTVASGTGIIANMWLQIDVAANAEVVQVLSVATNVVTLQPATPIRLTHLTGVAVTNTTTGNGKYTHVFSTLNSAANGAQPPTHTLTDISGIPASTGARMYGSSCVSEVVLNGNAQQFLTWQAKGQGWLSGIAGSTPTFAPSTQPAQAAWNSIAGIGGPATGGTLINYVSDWSVTIQRKLEPVWTTQGVQNPYVIARGGLTVALKLLFEATPSEAPLLALLNNNQPQTQFVATGPNSSSITVDGQTTAYETAKLNDGKAVYGYDVSARYMANTTNVGNSGGYSPIKITIVNAVPTY